MTGPAWESLDKSCRVFIGDMRHVLPMLPENHYHSCVTDPPYELGFMGKGWDRSGVSFHPETWEAVLRVLRPGAHLIAFGGSRTFHRLACAIEDAGFEIRDTLMWIYGSGFPKSLDVSKAIDKAAGAERKRIAGPKSGGMASMCKGNASHGYRDSAYYEDGNMMLSSEPATHEAQQWNGWGTALKPAFEPIILARKPLEGIVAANVLEYGTGAINIDGCRVYGVQGSGVFGSSNATVNKDRKFNTSPDGSEYRSAAVRDDAGNVGRWPANVIHDGSPEVLDRFPNTTSGNEPANGFRRNKPDDDQGIYGGGKGLWNEEGPAGSLYGDSGSAARFFYTAKAPKSERPTYTDENGKSHSHPTVKPLALMQYLCKLVTPNQGTILDPFAGSGATVEAAFLGHWNCDAIDLEQHHLPLIRSRIDKRCDNEQLFLGLTTSE